ncbi:MAG: type IX secretion system protein PorQ [Bacteroidales bacterium]|nr:type IX secretion system protein PorQ [Bacteroidales bacterium]
MKCQQFKILITLIISYLPIFAQAQIGGNYVYSFLSIGHSAQIESLGGKTVSHISPEIDMIAENPSYLAFSSDKNLSLSYTNSFTKINYGSSYYRLDSNWSIGLQFIHYGDFTRADERGFRYEKFSISEYAFILNYAKKLNKNLSVGLNFKPVISAFYPYSSYGISSDWGVYYFNPSKLFWTGFVIKNIGIQIKPYIAKNYEMLPLEINFGMTKKLEHAPFAFFFTFHNLQTPNLRYQILDENIVASLNLPQLSIIEQVGDNILRHSIIGVEIFPDKKLNIKLGYNYQKRAEMSVSTYKGITGYSFGISLKKSKSLFSYTYAKNHFAGGPHQISILLNTKSNYFENINFKKTINE